MVLSLDADWHRPFWDSPYRLRFELSNGGYVGRYITKFTASYDRARRLARLALPSENFVAIVAAYSDPSSELGAERFGWNTGTGFEHLAEMGIPTTDAFASWSGFWWENEKDDPEAVKIDHRAIDVYWQQADILIWNQVSQGLGIAPRAPVFSKFVDLERGICIDIYDDRGMDVISIEKATLSGLYSEYDTDLLDYDRDRMAAVFED